MATCQNFQRFLCPQHMCACLPLATRVKLAHYNWLNKFYSLSAHLYDAGAYCQKNKVQKILLFQPFTSYYEAFYISTTMQSFTKVSGYICVVTLVVAHLLGSCFTGHVLAQSCIARLFFSEKGLFTFLQKSWVAKSMDSVKC